MLKIADIKEGSVVWVKPAFGMEPAIRVTVTDGLEPHKYAEAFGYDHPTEGPKWAYDHQVSRVVSL